MKPTTALRAAIFAAALLMLPSAWAGDPCCAVVSVDTRTGVVTALDKATQRRFEFKLDNAVLLNRIRPGQGVSVDVRSGKVTLDGIAGQYNIVAAPGTGVPTVPGQRPAAGVSGGADAVRGSVEGQGKGDPIPTESARPSIGAAPPPLQQPQRQPVAPPIGAAPPPAQQPQAHAPIGGAPKAIPSAPGTLGSLAKGSAAATAIITPRDAPGTPGGAAQPRIPRDTAAAPGISHGRYALPTITAGTPVMATAGADRRAQRPSFRGNGIHLRGLDEIDSSTAIPESAKILLMMHVGTLPENASDHYIVNPQLAAEWAKTHKVPASMKPTKKKKKKKKCDWTHSGGCADQVQQTAQDIWDSASEDWKRAWTANTKNLAEDWKEAVECFADHRLRLSDIPVKFSVAPEFPVSLEKSASKGGGSGKASGSAKGTLTVGLPVQGDFRAQVELFYIPCLPFAIRPRSVGADGTMTVAARLGASVVATGKFEADYTIPPGGGPAIPIAVIPIVIGGVPVAILDVALYVDGTVRVGGEGQLDGKFQLTAPYRSDFDFDCDGRGCKGRMRNVPVPTTTTENVVLKGSVHVQPAIFTALQLSLNFDALAGRAGPQPFLYGEVRGCSATAAAQNTSGVSTAQEFHALTADLDWGIEFRAEALVAGEQVASYVVDVMKPRHIWFGDIAPGGSTALAPGLSGPVQLAAGSAGAFVLKSRPCHPFADAVEYRLTWSGSATASTPTPGRNPAYGREMSVTACNWGNGQASCRMKPGVQAPFTLAWPQGGAFTVTATPVRDAHGREFRPDRVTQMNINVQ